MVAVASSPSYDDLFCESMFGLLTRLAIGALLFVALFMVALRVTGVLLWTLWPFFWGFVAGFAAAALLFVELGKEP